MKTLTRLVVVLAFAALIPIAHGGGKKPSYKTPQDAFAALKNAVAKEDMRAFASCLTDESRKLLVGTLAVSAAQSEATIKLLEKDSKTPEQEKMLAEMKDNLARLRKVLKKHGVKEEEVKKALDEAKSGDKDAFKKAFIKLADQISNHSAFFEDAYQATKKKYGKADEDMRKAMKNAQLKDLKIDGDTAKGKVITKRDDTERSDPITFRREQGSWRVDLFASKE
jgi:hypothetical protein